MAELKLPGRGQERGGVAAYGGPKLVHVTFHVTEGPKVKIRDVDFVGNQAISDGALNKRMKENKEKGFFGFITGIPWWRLPESYSYLPLGTIYVNQAKTEAILQVFIPHLLVSVALAVGLTVWHRKLFAKSAPDRFDRHRLRSCRH